MATRTFLYRTVLLTLCFVMLGVGTASADSPSATRAHRDMDRWETAMNRLDSSMSQVLRVIRAKGTVAELTQSVRALLASGKHLTRVQDETLTAIDGVIANASPSLVEEFKRVNRRFKTLNRRNKTVTANYKALVRTIKSALRK